MTESAAAIALLSRNFERARYGRMEWQAMPRADPDGVERRPETVRIEDVPVDGLLVTLTYIDLVAAAGPVAFAEVGTTLSAADIGVALGSTSPSTWRTDKKMKLALYAAAGIPHHWRLEREPAHASTSECSSPTQGSAERDSAYGSGSVACHHADGTMRRSPGRR
ncbi:hypothetical protein [Kitasatospora purpeofusca]|uniref:hypothetical protein n=1 Tax=Kitasatospora purpeofusca TaxID=67352 RepID=UPI002A5A1CF0|nr:hypothetical protein [Kitasatospora purpeofusca]MDY0812274.1 hypothetical protein [Kitasatospora purpeofusca]